MATLNLQNNPTTFFDIKSCDSNEVYTPPTSGGEDMIYDVSNVHREY